MAEPIQRVVKPRALEGQYPTAPQQIIQSLEAVAAPWHRQPPPFVWAGNRKARRDRAALRRYRLGASGAAIARPSRRRFFSRCPWQPPHERPDEAVRSD